MFTCKAYKATVTICLNMLVYSKRLHTHGGSKMIVLPKEWLDRNGNPENVLIYVTDSELRVSTIPCKGSNSP